MPSSIHVQLTADLCDKRPVSFPENRDDDLCGTKPGNRCFLRENPIRYVFDSFVFRIYDLSLESEILRKRQRFKIHFKTNCSNLQIIILIHKITNFKIIISKIFILIKNVNTI